VFFDMTFDWNQSNHYSDDTTQYASPVFNGIRNHFDDTLKKVVKFHVGIGSILMALSSRPVKNKGAEKVDPCDDFYEFACGNYGLNRNLPASKPLRHTISDVQSRLNKQVKSILQMPILDTESKWDRLAKGYYQKCLDEEELERTGLTAIKEIIDWVGGWPTLQGSNWKEWNYSWEHQLALLMNRTGVNAVILELAVTHDPANSTNSLDQPKWGVGSPRPYLMGPDDPMLKNYTHLMTLTAIALGAEPKLAEKEMYEAMELELKLVNFSADDMVRRDPDRGNNRFQLWQLKSHFPLINFEQYVTTVFKGLANVSPNHTVIIREIEYFTGIQHILTTTPKRVIANYVAWRLVQGFSPFLPPTAREPFYQFKANQTGMFNSPPPDRWEDCVTLSVIMMDMPVGKLFVEHFFERERAMAKMQELTAFLKGEFIKQLNVLDWMDESTRRRAVEKAGMIEYKNGFPEVLFNDTWMDEHWGIIIKPKEYLLHLTIRIKLARYAEELMRLDQPLDRTMWYQSPAQVDAYYAPNNNEMIFPAGIMQFPFLTLGVPNYVTYGMVGAVIGHEVSHAFDDQGGRYDELGNLNDWWDTGTAEKFTEKT
ncbi:peptidase family M13, partial [Teladorsagia circumcincta]